MDNETIEAMNDNQLRILRDSLDAELRRRDNIAKEKAWRTIQLAIRDYVSAYGNITITDGYDDVTITAHAEFDTIGRIEDYLPED